MKNIYLDTFKIHDWQSNTNGIYVANPIEGLEFPELRQASYDRPGEYGAFVANNLYGGRSITLNGNIFSLTSAVDFEAKRRAFILALRLVKDLNAEIQPIVLKFTTMDDLALEVDVHVRDFRMRRDLLQGAEFMIDLYAPEYFLRSQITQSTSVSRAVGGGGIIPIIIPAVLGASVGGLATINNQGTAEAFPLLYLSGPLTNPIIQNNTINRYIQLMMTINTGEQVIIDMRDKTIMNGFQSVLGQKTSGSQFWWLTQGNNNISVLTDSSSDTGSVQVQWQNSYLGI